eukprot:1722072-Rhodomonas_salina.1
MSSAGLAKTKRCAYLWLNEVHLRCTRGTGREQHVGADCADRFVGTLAGMWHRNFKLGSTLCRDRHTTEILTQLEFLPPGKPDRNLRGTRSARRFFRQKGARSGAGLYRVLKYWTKRPSMAYAGRFRRRCLAHLQKSRQCDDRREWADLVAALLRVVLQLCLFVPWKRGRQGGGVAVLKVILKIYPGCRAKSEFLHEKRENEKKARDRTS